MDPFIPGSLEEQVAHLRHRVLRLEQLLQAHGIVETPAASQPARTSEIEQTTPAAPASQFPSVPAPSPVFASRLIEPPRFATIEPGGQRDSISMESRIGSQWFNRVGILAVLIGMAWFVKLAIDNHWIGPLGRVLIGLIAGAGLVAWSERFRSRGYSAFSYSLKAIGSGILYIVALGRVLALPSGSRARRLPGHDRCHGIQRLPRLGAGCGTAGAVCDCRRLQHARPGFHRRKPRGHAVQLPADARHRRSRAGGSASVVAPAVRARLREQCSSSRGWWFTVLYACAERAHRRSSSPASS